jgi:hypothetical protein
MRRVLGISGRLNNILKQRQEIEEVREQLIKFYLNPKSYLFRRILELVN